MLSPMTINCTFHFNRIQCLSNCLRLLSWKIVLMILKTWMLNDKLKLNDGKTDFFIIGTRQQLEKVNFDTLRIGDSYVTAPSEAKDLGFWFDSQMKCDTNVNRSCKAAFFHLFNIRRIRKFLTHETAQILINSFVTSRLDYCKQSVLWFACKSA